jgi:hypothetical protein
VRTREAHAASLRNDEVFAEDLRTRNFIQKPLQAVDDRERNAVGVIHHHVAVMTI